MPDRHQHRYAFHSVAPGPAIVERCSCGKRRKTQATRCAAPDSAHEGGEFRYQRKSCGVEGCVQGYIKKQRSPACCCAGLVAKGEECVNCRDATESHGGAIVHQCMVLNDESLDYAAALAQSPPTKRSNVSAETRAAVQAMGEQWTNRNEPK